MGAVRKIKGSLVKQDIGTYVGESTYLFYDTESGDLRIYDGLPGGTSLLTSVIVTTSNVTTEVIADSMTRKTGKWILTVTDVVTPTNVVTEEILATHNGTDVAYTEYAILKLGSAITGLTINVTLTGGDTMNVTVASTSAVDIKINRTARF